MQGALANASLARIPRASLSRLSALRAYAGVEVREEGERAWVRWDEAGFEILKALLPIEGAEFFERVGDPSTGSGQAAWHLCGHSLPYFEIPEDGFRPFASVLSPGAAMLQAADETLLPKVVLAVRRSGLERVPTGMLCVGRDLAAWADMAVESQIRRLYAARSGELILLVGSPLPAISNSEKYWGDRLLCPLGWSPDPALAESALLDALGIADDELALIRKRSVEVIPRGALQRLSRASARLGAS